MPPGHFVNGIAQGTKHPGRNIRGEISDDEIFRISPEAKYQELKYPKAIYPGAKCLETKYPRDEMPRNEISKG